MSLKDIIFKIGDKLNKSNLIRLGTIPVSEDEPPFLIADVKRLANEVGWRPEYDMDKGLDSTIEWWQNSISQRNQITSHG